MRGIRGDSPSPTSINSTSSRAGLSICQDFKISRCQDSTSSRAGLSLLAAATATAALTSWILSSESLAVRIALSDSAMRDSFLADASSFLAPSTTCLHVHVHRIRRLGNIAKNGTLRACVCVCVCVCVLVCVCFDF